MSDSDLQEPRFERLSATPESDSVPLKTSKKRKRSSEKDSGNKKAEGKSNSKKAKAQAEDEDLDLTAGLNNAFSRMNNQLLADYLAQRTRKYESDLSGVELEDKYIAGKSPKSPMVRSLMIVQRNA